MNDALLADVADEPLPADADNLDEHLAFIIDTFGGAEGGEDLDDLLQCIDEGAQIEQDEDRSLLWVGLGRSCSEQEHFVAALAIKRSFGMRLR